MPRTHLPISETHIVGQETHEWKVRAEECPALALHHIAHVGIADTAAPYEIVRMNLSGSYLLFCSSGEGRILLDGRWQLCKAGWACLAPPHALLAFHTEPNSRWEFTWVRYQQPPDQKPFMSSSSPAVARFDSLPLRAAVQGLFFEMQSQLAPATISHWVELIHTYVLRFARPWQTDDRLSTLWEFVATRLGEPWSLDRLAQHSHLSTEHLRRLCRRELGRSPMHHVIFLRMQLAAKLLATTSDKIETIADAVGYENPFVFSTTFKKWVGWRPSDYRINQR
ncbi:MAG: Transcriptional regulator, AraC family [Chthoniobacteraceae bacterium]|nr:Transcriptional regulator, AraC family [Chthoniobacteraceae bacterium]